MSLKKNEHHLLLYIASYHADRIQDYLKGKTNFDPEHELQTNKTNIKELPASDNSFYSLVEKEAPPPMILFDLEFSKMRRQLISVLSNTLFFFINVHGFIDVDVSSYGSGQTRRFYFRTYPSVITILPDSSWP